MINFSATLVESNRDYFNTRSRDGLSYITKVEIGKNLHARGREAVAGVRSLYASHRKTGNLYKRIDWKAPYKSISENRFAKYNREALFMAVGIYDSPTDTRKTGARSHIARYIERGTKRRFTKSSKARRGSIRAKRYLEKGAKLSREEVKLVRAITKAERKAAIIRRRRSYKVA